MNVDLPLFSTVQKSMIFNPDLVMAAFISDLDTITIRADNFTADSIMLVVMTSSE